MSWKNIEEECQLFRRFGASFEHLASCFVRQTEASRAITTMKTSALDCKTVILSIKSYSESQNLKITMQLRGCRCFRCPDGASGAGL